MPNWKKLITSGSHASLSSVTGSILLSGDLQANSNNILGVAKVGAASNDEYFDFGTDAMIKVAIDNTEDFRFVDGGTFHANVFFYLRANHKKIHHNKYQPKHN